MEEKKRTGYPSIDKPWLQYYSEGIQSNPLPENSLYGYLWEKNKDFTGRFALRYFGKRIRYKEMFSSIDNACRAFMALGVKKNDTVSMCLVTIPETVYSFYALNRIGAITNWIDPRTSESGITQYLNETHSKYLVVLDACYEKIRSIISDTSIEQIVILSVSDSMPIIAKTAYNLFCKPRYSLAEHGAITWKTLIEKATDIVSLPPLQYDKNTPAVIVHTGGTTGLPKGVVLSSDSINAAVYQGVVSGGDYQREHVWLNIMPPFIAYGIGNGLHLPLTVGMEVVLIPKFDPETYDKLLLKHKPNHIAGVPSHYDSILHSKRLKNADLSFIVSPIVGGDTMNPDMEESINCFLHQHGCKSKVIKGYGLTEVCAAVCVCSPKHNEVGSVGVPFVKTVISIFDIDTNEEQPYNALGEICVTCPNTMIGYLNNETATKNILKLHSDGKTWVHTADIGYMDKDGFLFIVDRAKRLIIRSDGFKVYPAIIENTITKHSAVESCAVIGIPSPGFSQGMVPKAFVVFKRDSGKRADEMLAEIRDLCRRELPEYAQPSEYVFIDTLPLTPIGKVDYRALERPGIK